MIEFYLVQNQRVSLSVQHVYFAMFVYTKILN